MESRSILKSFYAKKFEFNGYFYPQPYRETLLLDFLHFYLFIIYLLSAKPFTALDFNQVPESLLYLISLLLHFVTDYLGFTLNIHTCTAPEIKAVLFHLSLAGQCVVILHGDLLGSSSMRTICSHPL